MRIHVSKPLTERPHAQWLSRPILAAGFKDTDRHTHCQTFENRSSPPPKPAAGLDVLVVFVVVVLLVHPPNSSSAATLGANPPEAPGTMGWLASDPHPKSLAVVVVEGLGGAGSALGASAVAHALPPHALESDQLLVVVEPTEPRGFELVMGAAAVGAGFCWAVERLKTDGVVVAGGETTAG